MRVTLKDMQPQICQKIPLSQAERLAMLKVWDGYEPKDFILVPLHHLDIHMPRHLLLSGLEWLERNKLVGKKLADFILHDCASDNVEFQTRITQGIYKDSSLKLIAGVNFK